MTDKGWQRREVMAAAAATAAVSGSGWAVPGQEAAADLARVFADPPTRARPGCYWYWMGGAVTDAGITRDLSEMKAAGLGAAYLFSIGKAGEHPLVSPPADALTETWWARVAHAAREAERLGLELALNACDGWATASGPWITPELSMQHLVWTDRVVDGGRAGLVAERPPATLDYYRDIATLALPVEPGWEETSANAHARVTSDLPVSDLARLVDPANGEQVVDTERGGWFQFAFDRPFTLRSVTVRTANATSGFSPGVYRAANSLWVEASDDGRRFRPVGRLDYPQHGWQTEMTTLSHALPPTTARVFRLVHRPEGPFAYEEERDFGQDTALKLSSLTLSAMPVVQSLPVKSGEQWGRARRMTAADVPDADCVAPDRVIDVTDRIGPDGRLTRPLPPGRWRLLRLGYTTTGKGNSAAGAGQGLECSRFEPAAADAQYDGWFGRVRGRLGALGKAFSILHVDSWEAGTQNWSPTFVAAFHERRGYDLRRWLPVMAGVPMGSADETERVLFDVRRTIADLAHDVFYATLAKRTAADGVLFSGEPASPTFPVDGLDHARFLDRPMGEFWYNTPRNDKPNDVADAVSGGRIYGRQVIGTESFTEGLITWREQPASYKALGDHHWAVGVNRFLLHVWCGQPFPGRGPGMTLNGIGSQINYLQSWWKPGKGWFDYLGRGQALLQEGRAVADIAYFIGEDVPTRALLPRMLRPALPQGYSYDSINRDALIRLARVEGGWIVLPGGARYRLLVLPPGDRMSPELATALARLAAAGACVSGPRPTASWGLDGGDAAVAWAGAGWSNQRDLAPLLIRLGLAPDVRLTAQAEPNPSLFPGVGRGPGEASDTAASHLGPGLRRGTEVVGGAAGPDGIEWTHRQGPGWDLYFFSNQRDRPVAFAATCRVTGAAPALWDAETGTRAPAAGWHPVDGGTAVPLTLDAHGSIFVLFTAGTTARGAVLAAPQPAGTVAGPWLVRFADHLPAPVTRRLDRLSSWTEDADPALRFYAGLATYETMAELPRLRPGERLWLDLGDVASLATVRLNGVHAGYRFRAPFRLDVTAVARPGPNRLAVDVANTWRNRLIGDFGRPENERVSFVNPLTRKEEPWLPGGPGATLDPAGLLGPVRWLIQRPA